MHKKLISYIAIFVLVTSLLPTTIFADADIDSAAKVKSGSHKHVPARSITSTENGINTGVEGDDECTDAIDIGFDFDIYGQTFSDVYINTNGTIGFQEILNTDYVEGESDPADEYICFDDYTNDTAFLDGTGDEIPPDYTIFAFWDDLESYHYNILTATIGEPGERKFIVQWTNTYLYSAEYGSDDNPLAGPPLGTFQVILYEETGEITMQYLNLLQGDSGRGMEATIGITGDISEDENTVAHHLLSELSSGTSITFAPEVDEYDISNDVIIEDIILSDGTEPTVGLDYWYKLDGSLEDEIQGSTMSVTGDNLTYDYKGDENLPMVSSDGTSSFLQADDIVVPNSDVSFSIAIYPTALPAVGDEAVLLYGGAGLPNLRFLLTLNDEGQINLSTDQNGLEGQGATTTSTVNLNEINFISAVYEQGERQWGLYLNGTWEATTTTYADPGDFADITVLATALGPDEVDTNQVGLTGFIGAIGVWDRMLDHDVYVPDVYNSGDMRLYEFVDVANEDTLLPTFTWNAYQGNTVVYELIVATDPLFEVGAENEDDYAFLNNSIVFQQADIEDTEYVFEDLETSPFKEGEQYYYMVVAKSIYGEGHSDFALTLSKTYGMNITNTADFSGDGTGSELDPYIVSDCDQLMEINNFLHDDLYFELSTDLDCTEDGNNIIIGSETEPFDGVFNGNDHTITVDINTDSHAGLFAKVQDATIANLTVEGTITGSNAGAVVGVAVESSFLNLTATAETLVNGVGDGEEGVEDNAGGVIGILYKSEASNIIANGTVTGQYENIGGVFGHVIRSTVEDSWANVSVTGGEDASDVGGFAGDIDYSTITDSYSDGVVSGESYIGGFVGDSDTFAEFIRVYSDATVNATGNDTGGLIGGLDDFSTLEQVYATGNVTSTGVAVIDGEGIQNKYAGGLVGSIENGIRITDAYAIGDVSGDVVGGLIGEIDEEFSTDEFVNNGTRSSILTNVYSKGSVTSNGEYVLSGLIGIINGESTVSNSYWNTETSGTTESAAGEGITIAQMQNQSTFTGWNFDDVWTSDDNNVINSGYPYFGWQESLLEYTDVFSSRSSSTTGSKINKDLTYDEEVAAMLEAGIVNENPENSTNKCEALVMMSRVFEWQVPTAISSNYTDVPEWCVSVAAFGTERGIVEGRTTTTLGMETPVSRDEVALMIYRELKKQNFEFKGTAKFEFTDTLTPWAKEAIEALSKEGIIKGFSDGTFGGSKNILKQDLGVMLMRITK